LFVGVWLCSSYTKEVVMGRMLSTREQLIMNTTITTPECQTLGITDAATALGVCKETVRRLVRRKVLRKLPGLRRILIPRAEIQRYLNEH
jgi:excisionase family DNA binding protein